MRLHLDQVGKLVLLILFLGGPLITAIVIPIHHENVQNHGNKLDPILENNSAVHFPRAGLVPRPPALPKPATPKLVEHPSGPPPRLTPVDTVEPGPPPHLTPGDPVDAPAQLVKPNTPDSKKPSGPGDTTPVNPGPKPDPSGPVPSEAEIMAQCNVPRDKAIFWSGTQDKVYPFRDQMKLTSDDMSYPPGYVTTFAGPSGIVGQGSPKNVKFADEYSRVFANKAEGEVHVMVPWETGPNPNRVFHSQEWPALKEGLRTGRITKIIQVNPDNYAETRIYDPTIYGLTKRAAAVDLNNVPWDVNLDALAEAWKRSPNAA